MRTFVAIITFFIILFIYIHVYFHLKKGNHLEVYEIEDMSKDKLEEICDLRQPIIFSFENDLSNTFNINNLISNYESFDLKLRNMETTYKNIEKNKDNICSYVPICLNDCLVALKNDKKSLFVSENNYDFLEETTLLKQLQSNDSFLRPYNVSNCDYDLIFGSKNTNTLFKYEVNYRNFFYVSQGSINIKLTPPNSKKYLNCNYDYENMEFSSPINPWKVQDKYNTNFNKIKCLEINLNEGQIIFIPAYWWYSIKFSKNTIITSLKYKTYMNNIAIFPQLFIHSLQKLNIERKTFENKLENVVKTINSKNNSNTLNNYELFYDNPKSNNATNIGSNLVNNNKLDEENALFNNNNFDKNIIDSGQATELITKISV